MVLLSACVACDPQKNRLLLMWCSTVLREWLRPLPRLLVRSPVVLLVLSEYEDRFFSVNSELLIKKAVKYRLSKYICSRFS